MAPGAPAYRTEPSAAWAGVAPRPTPTIAAAAAATVAPSIRLFELRSRILLFLLCAGHGRTPALVGPAVVGDGGNVRLRTCKHSPGYEGDAREPNVFAARLMNGWQILGTNSTNWATKLVRLPRPGTQGRPHQNGGGGLGVLLDYRSSVQPLRVPESI